MTFRLYNSNKNFPDLTPAVFSASRVENRYLVSTTTDLVGGMKKVNDLFYDSSATMLLR
jgi:hypothetical protein